MLYMQLMSAVRCHRFKGGEGSYSTATDSEETNEYYIYITLLYPSHQSMESTYLKVPKNFKGGGGGEGACCQGIYNLQIEQSNFLHQRQSPP